MWEHKNLEMLCIYKYIYIYCIAFEYMMRRYDWLDGALTVLSLHNLFKIITSFSFMLHL